MAGAADAPESPFGVFPLSHLSQSAATLSRIFQHLMQQGKTPQRSDREGKSTIEYWNNAEQTRRKTATFPKSMIMIIMMMMMMIMVVKALLLVDSMEFACETVTFAALCPSLSRAFVQKEQQKQTKTCSDMFPGIFKSARSQNETYSKTTTTKTTFKRTFNRRNWKCKENECFANTKYRWRRYEKVQTHTHTHKHSFLFTL